jgi:hypothetical protein
MHAVRSRTFQVQIGTFVLLILGLLPGVTLAQTSTDVVVYGATPAGVSASIAAAREGEKVILLEPSSLIGGVVAGGLTKTDIGRRDTVGGFPNEFFRRVLAYYETTFGKDSVQVKQCHEGIFFEPHVAEAVFKDMLRDAGVQVRKGERISSVDLQHNKISAIHVTGALSGVDTQYIATIFIDASYEGDLMAKAGVPYRVGREATTEYGESLAGYTHGLPQYIGAGDQRVQSFNIRSTLTNRDDIRLPISKPAHYTPEVFAGFLAHIREKHLQTFDDVFPDVPLWGPVNGKSDPNKADDVGANLDYADGTDLVRQRSYEHTRDLWLTFWYMLQHDPSLSPEFRASALKWGVPKDEFVDSGHVSPQLYVREARRMQGSYMMSQKDVQTDRYKEDGIAMGSYAIDSHPVQVIITPRGRVEEGGDIGGWTDPYNIPYRSITPVAPENLLVVVDISATHIAYCTVRMEPVFMMLGQAGGIAASLAIQSETSVQNVSISQLRGKLKAAGVPLDPPFRPSVVIEYDPHPQPGKPVQFHAVQKDVRTPIAKYYWNFDGSGKVQSRDADPVWQFSVAKPWLVSLYVEDAGGNKSLVNRSVLNLGADGPDDITVPFQQSTNTGLWDRVGIGGLDERNLVAYHDLDKNKGKKSIMFTTDLPSSGRYLIAIAFPQGAKRATNVPIKITSGENRHSVTLNERNKETPFAFSPLGIFAFDFNKPASLEIDTTGTDGDVAIEAVKWIWLGPR